MNNNIVSSPATSARTDRQAIAPAPAVSGTARPQPRVRDFGIGYGRSSGYVQRPRYTSPSAPLFRVS